MHSKTRRLLATAALALAAWIAASDARAISPEEFAELPPERALQLPALSALEVFGWSRREFLFVLENALIDLRYLYVSPTGRASSALTTAVRAFQSDIAHEPTGVLTVSEFMLLAQRGNQFSQVPIFTGPAIVSVEETLVLAEGTWAAIGFSEADPIQTTKLRCERAQYACSAATATVRMSDAENPRFHSSAGELDLDLHAFAVRRWDTERLEAETVVGECRVDTLVVDLRTRTAHLQRNITRTANCDSQLGDRRYDLANGYAISNAYWESRRDQAHRLRSQAFQRLVEDIQRRTK